MSVMIYDLLNSDDLESFVNVDLNIETSRKMCRFYTQQDFVNDLERLLKDDYQAWLENADQKALSIVNVNNSPNSSITKGDYAHLLYKNSEIYQSHPDLQEARRRLHTNRSQDIIKKNLFKIRLWNFNKFGKKIFEYFVNTTDSAEYTTDFDEGAIIIKLRNQSRSSETINLIDTKVNINSGIVIRKDTDLAWVVDEALSKKIKQDLNDQGIGKANDNMIYLMSPLMRHAMCIFDKLRNLSKQKKTYIYPKYLRDAVNATFNDARIVEMGERYMVANTQFIRAVPILTGTANKGEMYGTRFFDPTSDFDVTTGYSYADITSGGSGKNKVTLDDYYMMAIQLEIHEIVFTQEMNTNKGLFSWSDRNFIAIKQDYEKTHGFVEGDKIETFKHHLYYDDGIQLLLAYAKYYLSGTDCKKIIQRIKLLNSKSYELLNKDAFFESKSGLRFLRNENFLRFNSYTPKELDWACNALVAIVENDIEVVKDYETYRKMSYEEQEQYHLTLDGVSCELFLNKKFLDNLIIVPRTTKLACSEEEFAPEFKEAIEKVKNGERVIFKRDSNFLAYKHAQCMECKTRLLFVNDNYFCSYCNMNIEDVKATDIRWADMSKDFISVEIKEIKKDIDGYNLYVDYHVKFGEVRFVSEDLIKGVGVHTNQDYIGYVPKLVVPNLVGGEDYVFNNVAVDAKIIGYNCLKGKDRSLPYGCMRLANAVNGIEIFNGETAVKNPEDFKEFLDKFKKQDIVLKVYNPRTKQYDFKTHKAWIGIIPLKATEVAQEYNQVKSDSDLRKFSKMNYSLYNILGLIELSKALEEENRIRMSNSITNELLKIRESLLLEKDQVTVNEDLRNLTDLYRNNADLFRMFEAKSFAYKDFLNREEYHELKNFPLFKKPEFEKGFYLNLLYEVIVDKKPTYKAYQLRFPERKFLLSLIDDLGGGRVKLSPILNAYLGVFENLCTAFIDNTPGRYPILRDKNGIRSPVAYWRIQNRLLEAIDEELEGKEGEFVINTSINTYAIASKQVSCIRLPYNATVVANDRNYKVIMSKVFKSLFPDRVQDWDCEPIKNEYGNITGYTKLGWCWTEEYYTIAHRDPIVMAKQNQNIMRMYSKHAANIMYLEKWGEAFSTLHPGSKAIYINSVFMVADVESDVDGDYLALLITVKPETQKIMKEAYLKIKDMAYYHDNDSFEAQMLNKYYSYTRFNYLVEEASNLVVKLPEKLTLEYEGVDEKGEWTSWFKHQSLTEANFEASRNKMDIGVLTTSLWQVVHLFNYLEAYKEENALLYPKLVLPTEEEKYAIMFIFEYLLLQRNGVRAMKAESNFGKITFNALMKNSVIKVKSFVNNEAGNTTEIYAFDLFQQMLDDYKKESGQDLSFVIPVLQNIKHNFMISNGKGTGGGFAQGPNGIAFIGDKDKYGKLLVSNFPIDPRYKDFLGLFYTIHGTSNKAFVSQFGEVALLNGIKTGVLDGIPSLKYINEDLKMLL